MIVQIVYNAFDSKGLIPLYVFTQAAVLVTCLTLLPKKSTLCRKFTLISVFSDDSMYNSLPGLCDFNVNMQQLYCIIFQLVSFTSDILICNSQVLLIQICQ